MKIMILLAEIKACETSARAPPTCFISITASYPGYAIHTGSMELTFMILHPIWLIRIIKDI